jgi:hypothetical protein
VDLFYKTCPAGNGKAGRPVREAKACASLYSLCTGECATLVETRVRMRKPGPQPRVTEAPARRAFHHIPVLHRLHSEPGRCGECGWNERRFFSILKRRLESSENWVENAAPSTGRRRCTAPRTALASPRAGTPARTARRAETAYPKDGERDGQRVGELRSERVAPDLMRHHFHHCWCNPQGVNLEPQEAPENKTVRTTRMC